MGFSVLPTHFEPSWVWGYSKGLTVPTSQTLFAFQASPTVRAKGSAMKPSSEPLELLTVTQQNGFTAHINWRASLHLAFDK